MADVSKLKLNNVVYDLKDAKATRIPTIELSGSPVTPTRDPETPARTDIVDYYYTITQDQYNILIAGAPLVGIKEPSKNTVMYKFDKVDTSSGENLYLYSSIASKNAVTHDPGTGSLLNDPNYIVFKIIPYVQDNVYTLEFYKSSEVVIAGELELGTLIEDPELYEDTGALAVFNISEAVYNALSYNNYSIMNIADPNGYDPFYGQCSFTGEMNVSYAARQGGVNNIFYLTKIFSDFMGDGLASTMLAMVGNMGTEEEPMYGIMYFRPVESLSEEIIVRSYLGDTHSCIIEPNDDTETSATYPYMICPDDNSYAFSEYDFLGYKSFMVRYSSSIQNFKYIGVILGNIRGNNDICTGAGVFNDLSDNKKKIVTHELKYLKTDDDGEYWYAIKFEETEIGSSLPTVINDRYLHTNASTGALEWSEVQQGGVTGVKGNAETDYRTGQVNLTAANIGAEPADATILKQADVVNTLTSDSTVYPLSAKQGKELKSLIDALPSPMVFKGTVGTGGTVETLPTTGVKIGHTYKAISEISIPAERSETGEVVTAKIGDLVIATATTPKWIVVPSGDEPKGTVTNIATGTGLTGGPITTSGTIAVNFNEVSSKGHIHELTGTAAASASTQEVLTSVKTAGATPTLGTAITADHITSWAAGSAPTLGTVITADDITAWDAGALPTVSSVSVNSVSSWSAGTLPSLGTEIPADDITSWSAGTLPSLGTAISADDITSWSAGTLPSLGTAIPADDITSWNAGSFTATATETSSGSGIYNLTLAFTAPTLSYTAKSIPNVTSVGTLPNLSYSAKSIPNVTSVGTLPDLSYTAKSIPNVTSVGTLPSLSTSSIAFNNVTDVGSLPNLSYASRTIPNVTSVGSAPSLAFSSVSIPNVTSVGSMPTFNSGVAAASGHTHSVSGTTTGDELIQLNQVNFPSNLTELRFVDSIDSI